MSLLSADFLKGFLPSNSNPKASEERVYLHHEGRAETQIRLGSTGRIRLYGVSWLARSVTQSIIPIGAIVQIIGRDGVTLLVKPVKSLEKTDSLAKAAEIKA